MCCYLSAIETKIKNIIHIQHLTRAYVNEYNILVISTVMFTTACRIRIVQRIVVVRMSELT